MKIKCAWFLIGVVFTSLSLYAFSHISNPQKKLQSSNSPSKSQKIFSKLKVIIDDENIISDKLFDEHRAFYLLCTYLTDKYGYPPVNLIRLLHVENRKYTYLLAPEAKSLESVQMGSHSDSMYSVYEISAESDSIVSKIESRIQPVDSVERKTLLGFFESTIEVDGLPPLTPMELADKDGEVWTLNKGNPFNPLVCKIERGSGKLLSAEGGF